VVLASLANRPTKASAGGKLNLSTWFQGTSSSSRETQNSSKNVDEAEATAEDSRDLDYVYFWSLLTFLTFDLSRIIDRERSTS
jgi:hypothetical protein